MRVDGFRPLAEFQASMDDIIRRLKHSPKAEGAERIYIAGEKEFEKEADYRQHGVPLFGKVADALKQIGNEVGVPWVSDEG